MLNFQTLKSSLKLLNDIAGKKKSLQVWSVLYLHIYSAGIRGHHDHESSDCFEYSKQALLK